MTIETIKDVLGRILTINKNLNEESLKTLLDASGWDANDIKEGLRMYRDYVSGGNDMSKVIITGNENNIGQGAPNIIATQVVEAKPEIKKETENPAEKVTETSGSMLYGILNLNKTESVKVINHAEVEKPKVVVAAETSNTMPSSILEAYEHRTSLEQDVHDIEEYMVHQKPWGLIILNSGLFLITLALLVYIVLN